MCGFSKCLLALCAALVVASSVSARGQWVGENVGLLTNAKVKDELKLDEAQAEKVNALIQNLRDKLKEVLKDVQAMDISREERYVKLFELAQAANRECKKELANIVNADQMARYEEIERQRNGVGAMLDVEVQKRLKLTKDQKDKAETILRDFLRSGVALAKEFDVQPRKTQEKMVRWQVMKDEAMDKVLELLNTEQLAVWDVMKGKPFADR